MFKYNNFGGIKIYTTRLYIIRILVHVIRAYNNMYIIKYIIYIYYNTRNHSYHYPKRSAVDNNFVLELVFYGVRPVEAIYIKIGFGI